jgi:hypothetical protein
MRRIANKTLWDLTHLGNHARGETVLSRVLVRRGGTSRDSARHVWRMAETKRAAESGATRCRSGLGIGRDATEAGKAGGLKSVSDKGEGLSSSIDDEGNHTKETRCE